MSAVSEFSVLGYQECSYIKPTTTNTAKVYSFRGGGVLLVEARRPPRHDRPPLLLLHHGFRSLVACGGRRAEPDDLCEILCRQHVTRADLGEAAASGGTTGQGHCFTSSIPPHPHPLPLPCLCRGAEQSGNTLATDSSYRYGPPEGV